MARVVAWVVYPEGVEKVEIVKRGATERQLVRPVKNPITVEDEDGDVFVVALDSLYNDPVSASIAQAEFAQKYGLLPNPVEVDEEGSDEEGDDEEDEEEGDDEDD